MPLQQAPLDKFSAAEGERCLTDCKGSPGFPLRWLGDGVSLLLGWEFRLSTQVEKPQVTLAGGADITYCCSLGGRHWYCRWWVVVNIVLTLLGLLSHHPSQIKRGESPHYPLINPLITVGSQGYYVFQVLSYHLRRVSFWAFAGSYGASPRFSCILL